MTRVLLYFPDWTVPPPSAREDIVRLPRHLAFSFRTVSRFAFDQLFHPSSIPPDYPDKRLEDPGSDQTEKLGTSYRELFTESVQLLLLK
jgi:hypothetical protein